MPKAWLVVFSAAMAMSAVASAAPRASSTARRSKVVVAAKVASPKASPVPEGPRPVALDAPEQRPHQALGLPKPRAAEHPHAVVLSRAGFIALYDPDRKVPLVVSWSSARREARRSDEPREDAFVPKDIAQATLGDYASSSYAKGLLAPNASLIGALPQSRNGHLGPWSQFEEFYQHQADSAGKVAYVQAGAIFDGEPRTIGSGVAVPSHTYALVVIADERIDLKAVRPEEIGASVKLFAILLPNNDSEVKAEDTWMKYLVPVSRIAQRTHHPGFLTGFSEETRKVAWNYKAPARAEGGDWIVDGVVIRPALAKHDARRPGDGRFE